MVLMGHWWHAVAMPITSPAHASTIAPVASTHVSEHHASEASHSQSHAHHAVSDTCCDAPTASADTMSHASHSVQSKCGGEHACCSLQPAPVTQVRVPGFDAMPSQRHAVMHTLALNHLKERLFKPPRAAL